MEPRLEDVYIKVTADESEVVEMAEIPAPEKELVENERSLLEDTVEESML